jgi:hypothetical protein
MTSRRHPLLVTALALALTAAVSLALAGSAPAAPRDATKAASQLPPPVGHVFVVNLENKGFDETWGPGSAAPYLSTTLRGQGVLLNQYHGTAHNSLPNYIAQVTGQGPDPQTQSDCQVYSPFVTAGPTAGDGQYVGDGCVLPAQVPSLPGQLDASGRSWRGYMEDMGTPCRHPQLGAVDDTQKARVGDQYAVRHNPFMYLRSVTDSPSCAQHVVDLDVLTTDLASTATTPALSYITPNLCHDGHDSPCVDGQPGGLASADDFLRTWVPRITSSPAFQQDGALVITFDESDGPQTDASACCGEGPGPNSPLPGITGLGGGRVGALVLSRYVLPGSTSTTPYNHYSLLASIEDLWHLPHLGYAAKAGLPRFGLDVWNGRWS